MQICILSSHDNKQFNKAKSVPKTPNFIEMVSYSTDVAPEKDIGFSGAPSLQHGDMHLNIPKIKIQNREAKLQFLWHQYWPSLERNIQNYNVTYQTNMTNSIADDMIEYTIFKDVIASQ